VITVGVQKLPSDNSNVVFAAIVLTSDQILPNPIITFGEPSIYSRIYSQLGIRQDQYVLANVALIQVQVQLPGFTAYSYNARFVRNGTVLGSQFIGPTGPRGIVGPVGPTGVMGPPGAIGPTGPASSGSVDNFSYKKVDTNVTVTVPINQQMIVIGGLELEGTLDLIGELVLPEI